MMGNEEIDFYIIESLRKKHHGHFTHIEIKAMLNCIRTGKSFTTANYAPCMNCKSVQNTFYFNGGMLLCKKCYIKSQE